MRISSIFEKIANGTKITTEEINSVRVWANNAEAAMAFVDGLRNGRSNVFANSIRANNTSFSRLKVFDLVSDSSGFDFEIPPNCEHLFLTGSARTDRSAYNDMLAIRMNSDSGNNYTEQYDGGQNTSQIGGYSASQSFLSICVTTANSSTANAYGAFFAYLPNIRGGLWKSVIGVSGSPSYTATDMIVRTSGGFWKSTNPISKISFFSSNSSNIKAGSSVSVYGIL